MHLFVFTSLASTFIYGLFCDWRLLAIQLAIIALYFALAQRYNGRSHTPMRKKIVMSVWGEPNDSSCFAQLQVDSGNIDQFLIQYNNDHPGQTITYTHYFLKALGIVFNQIKGINGKLVFGRFVPFDSVNINTMVNIDNKDLGSAIVPNCQLKSLSQIRESLNHKVKLLKMKKDKDFNAHSKLAKRLPTVLVGVIMHLMSFCSYFLEIQTKKLKPNFLSNIVLTNVTDMEIVDSFAPNAAFGRTMCTVVLNKPTYRPVADQNLQVVVKKIMNVNITFDHRFADGAQGSFMALKLKEIISNPGKYFK